MRVGYLFIYPRYLKLGILDQFPLSLTICPTACQVSKCKAVVVNHWRFRKLIFITTLAHQRSKESGIWELQKVFVMSTADA